MSPIMTDLGSSLGVFALVFGIILGVSGLAMAGLAYPVYTRVLAKQRRKIAPEILALTEELMQ